jgi:hypothetical protein
MTAELPGMSDKDIDLSIASDTLTIRGEKKEDREEKGKNYYYSERSYGSFSRSIPLPRQIDADKVSTSFKKRRIDDNAAQNSGGYGRDQKKSGTDRISPGKGGEIPCG